ncbi:MAG: helix-turn-helix transcriptional regulator [Eubacteriales bacterium]|nr:helix-turn-helix transcriptional regulator [Eubacteriales bacterium]
MNSTFSERLIEIIEDSGLKKTEFAERINVSQPHVSRMCSGETQPSNRTVKAICKEFNVSEEWLLYGKGRRKLTLSRDQEIKQLVENAMTGSSDFKKAVIRMICSRSEQELKLLADMLREIYENLPEEEKNTAAARSGDRMEAAELTKEEEDAVLPPPYTGDI